MPQQLTVSDHSMRDLFVEVRVPTFKRPELLRRALVSLQAQTWQGWRAVVLDDSAGREGERVLDELADPRICYRPNSANLGRVRNINHAFRSQAFGIEATHGCVLEDDNLFEPGLLEANLRAIVASGLPVLVRNYRMIDMDFDHQVKPNPDEPMRILYGSKARPIEFRERLLQSFVNFALGNLSYFWQFHPGLDLSMATEVFNTHVAETGRATAFDKAYWYEPEPHSIFTRFLCKSQTPAGESAATTRSRRLEKVSEVKFTRKLWHLCGRPGGPVLDEVFRLAGQQARLMETRQRLAEAGHFPSFLRLTGNRQRKTAVKTWFVMALYARQWRCV